jgi:PAS domain S-box-containing protein
MMAAAGGRRGLGWLGRSVWFPLSLALPLCAALALLHFYQQDQLGRAAALRQRVAQASRDLSQGVMHYLLGTTPGTPWEERQGRALFSQAVADYERAIRDAASRGLNLDEGATADFRTDVARLRGLLEVPRDARSETELRLVLYRVESDTRRIDRLLLDALAKQRAFLDRAFLVVSIVAFTLLAALCFLVFRLQRRTLSAMRLLDGVASASPDIIFVKDLQGRYLLFNPAAARILGPPGGDVLGRTDLELFPEVQAREVMAHDREVLEGGTTGPFEEVLATPEGDRTFLVTKGPLVSDEGEVFGTFGIARDISERKAAEKLQADSRARLAATIEALDVGLVLITADGNAVLWNRAAVEMHGFSSLEEAPRNGEALGEMFEFQWPDGRPLRYEEWPVHRIRAGERLRNLELHVRRRNTSWTRVFSYGGGMIEDPEHGGTVTLLTVADVTPRHLAEESVRRLQRVEAIGTLAAGIAHDFNNLLMAIGGNARLAQTHLENGEGAQSELAEIERASMRGSDLVRRIMLYSRAEESERKPLDLAAVAQEALRLLRPTTPAMISFDSYFEPGLPTVNADGSQIHQVLVNLLTNAVLAIEDGPRGGAGRIEVRLESLALDRPRDLGGQVVPPGQYVELGVRDDGCGMSQEVRSRIFDPFFTTRGPGRGTGLGLSVAHGIVQGHDGVIVVESWPNEGTSVRVVLPVAEGKPARPEVVTPSQVSLFPGTGKRILYVDDEESLVLLVRRWLGRRGHSVTAYTDPRQALAELKSRPKDFDLLVTDLAMPGMSGFDVAADALRIRADLPVLMMSGYVTTRDRERGRAMGIRELLLKPARIDELAEAIARHIDV